MNSARGGGGHAAGTSTVWVGLHFTRCSVPAWTGGGGGGGSGRLLSQSQLPASSGSGVCVPLSTHAQTRTWHCQSLLVIGGGRGQWLRGHHGECRARVCNGGLGAKPPAGSRGRAPGQGIRGRSLPEAESILVIGCPTEPANLSPFQNVLSNFVPRNKVLNHCRVIDAIQKVFMNFYHSIRYCVWIYQQQRINLTENSMLCYGPLVSELGGQSAWCPQPRHWGACASPGLCRLCC